MIAFAAFAGQRWTGTICGEDACEILCGRVFNADMVLYNDTRFAIMGNDDGLAHFNDLALGRECHEIKITFKSLCE